MLNDGLGLKGVYLSLAAGQQREVDCSVLSGQRELSSFSQEPHQIHWP